MQLFYQAFYSCFIACIDQLFELAKIFVCQFKLLHIFDVSLISGHIPFIGNCSRFLSGRAYFITQGNEILYTELFRAKVQVIGIKFRG